MNLINGCGSNSHLATCYLAFLHVVVGLYYGKLANCFSSAIFICIEASGTLPQILHPASYKIFTECGESCHSIKWNLQIIWNRCHTVITFKILSIKFSWCTWFAGSRVLLTPGISLQPALTTLFICQQRKLISSRFNDIRGYLQRFAIKAHHNQSVEVL